MSYDIWVGQDKDLKITPVRGVFNDDKYQFTTVAGAPWITTSAYDDKTGTVRVTVDLSKSSIASELGNEFASFCQPTTYCAVGTGKDGKTPACVCKPGTNCKDNDVCSWGPKAPDCPEEGCYGFAFTMPDQWAAPAQPKDPPAGVSFSTESTKYFDPANVQFKTVDLSKFGQKTQCQYTTPPTQ